MFPRLATAVVADLTSAAFALDFGVPLQPATRKVAAAVTPTVRIKDIRLRIVSIYLFVDSSWRIASSSEASPKMPGRAAIDQKTSTEARAPDWSIGEIL